MGLFSKDTYHCIICGAKVGKKAIPLSDGEKICSECHNKVYSTYVLYEVKSDKGYQNIDTNQMKQMQIYYAESARRAKQFVTTYKTENLYIDENHGWFIILNKDVSKYTSDINTQLKNPIEIFSVNDVDKIEYRAHRYGFDGKNYEFYYFNLSNQLLPYVPYNVVELPMKRDASFRIDVKLRNIFPNAQVDIPEFGMPAIIKTVYEEERGIIEHLPIQRKILNDQIDQLMAYNLPDKCKSLAKQYLIMDNQLQQKLGLLLDLNNFTNDTLLKECIEESKSYLAQMIKIYQEIQKKAMKQLNIQSI